MPEPVELASLSNRELDVVKLLLDGRSNEQIARHLHVSLPTVKSHAQAIFRKFGVHSRAELLAKFVERSRGGPGPPG
jgi:DNA-binding NarL/FixJ family response regulator